MQNIPSHATDIRHLFRATPGYVMLSSDYSAQEPRITAYVSQDPKMIKTFQEGKDIYANIASLSFGLPYEECLEFHPETGEYQPDGKKRRGEAKVIVLGICYGMSITTIAEQLYGKDDSLSQDDRNKKAQAVYDGVLNAFPNLRKLMISTDKFVREHGYVETILGRRRHIPEMLLPEFEFYAKEGYINPEIDPLDVSTLSNTNEIPQRMKDALLKEFRSYKYYGQIVKRTKELDEQHIRVVNNRHKISEASRTVINSVVQGSAADQTKLAMLVLTNNEDWKRIGGRLLVPVHDELIAEVPMEHWEEGGKILSSCMIQAAKFLPFDSKCDVTTTLRWYGLEYPCRYQKPISYDTIEPEEIKWIQYQLVEMEYMLPVIADGDEKPRGDAAVGINGKITQEYKDAIDNYIETRNILKDNFVETIEHEVLYGEVERL